MRFRRSVPLAAVAAVVFAAGLISGSAAMPAVAASAPAAAPTAARVAPSAIPAAQRDKVLPAAWRQSADLAWTTVGDSSGFHLMVAEERTGYAWRTVATLSEPGTETDQWIGQACVTGSQSHAVVVYAPRQLTNAADLQWRGAVAAIVDLRTGAVRKLPQRVSLAYFDPGCGSGDQVIVSREEGGGRDLGPSATRLMTVDTAKGTITPGVSVSGQVTGAVPYRGQIAAVRGNSLVSVDARGTVKTLVKTAGLPFRATVDQAGGLAYEVAVGKQAQIRRFADGKDQLVATTALGAVRVQPVGSGAALVGPQASRVSGGHLPGGWRAFDAATSAQVSTHGELVITDASNRIDPAGALAAPAPGGPLPVNVDAVVTGTRAGVSFTVDPGEIAPSGGAPSPALPPAPHKASTITPNVADASTVTTDPDRLCSVPRNDPQAQTYQPSPEQEEWAVDQGVGGHLAAQGLFPLPGLAGGGQVPPQIMLGILAQESAEFQASDHAIIGQTGNFMPSSNWYGDFGDFTYVDFAHADCGYGAAQVTSGMCRSTCPGDTVPPYPAASQTAIATDYRANIAAGLQILEQKWNQVSNAGMLVNGGDPQFLENWWFALWAYNSGFHAQGSDSSGQWGVGWVNNPINADYPPDREMFLSGNYDADVRVPSQWTYEEKVLGFAAFGLFRFSYVAQLTLPAFRAGTWPGGAPNAEPSHTAFCSSDNQCNPAQPANPCQRSDFKCWWHQPVTWTTTCLLTCGTGSATYGSGVAEPSAPLPSGYAPRCATSLPSNSVIVDDVSVPAVLGCPGQNYTSQGTMSWKFADDVVNGGYPSKIDFHQIGGGLGGHFWFTHTRTAADTTRKITGTWNPPTTVAGWTRIKVHLPNTGAWTRQADYHIDLGDGSTRHRVVNQAWEANTWVDIGVFNLTAGASVSLSNVTIDGSAADDIAWDGVAFIPTSKPSTFYVAMGDSYSSGEGQDPFDANSDYYGTPTAGSQKDACHRSTNNAYSRLVQLPGHSSSIMQESRTGAGTTSYAFLACSGAETVSTTLDTVGNLGGFNTDWGTVDYHFGEALQIDQGYLDADTTLVTVSIGGNDVRFADIVQGCILTTVDCAGSGYKLTRQNGTVDPEQLTTYEPKVIAALQSHLVATYHAIHDKAPNARIIVVGYPQLFADSPPVEPDSACGFLLSASDQLWMNQMGALLSQTISNAVTAVAGSGVNISYIDPTPAYRNTNGSHWACDATGTPWLNALVLSSKSGSTGPGKDGSGFDSPGPGSFHPTQAGQAEYAALVNSRLAGTG